MAARTGTFHFNLKGTEDLIQKVQKMHNYYVEISDYGTMRFSRKCATSFLYYLKNAIITGKYTSEVPPLSKHYIKWKNYMVGTRPMMIFSMDLYDSFEVYRSRVGGDAKRRGHVVGVKDSFNQDKLQAFEYGTDVKGGRWQAGEQPARPIFTLALNDFLAEEFFGILNQFVPSRGVW